MGGFGVMDHMVKSFRNNRKLLKGGKKSLKKIYEENNYFYVKKKIADRTKEFDPEKKQIFLQKFHTRQRKIRIRQTILFCVVLGVFSMIFFLLF